MSLIDRLAGISETPENPDKLSINAFWALLHELADGIITKAQIVAYFNLDTVEETELDWIISKYNAQPTAAAKTKFVELIKVFLYLAESRVPGYTSNGELVARINAI